MVFSSLIFLTVFLPVVLSLYLFVGPRLRNHVLLIASLFFYAWGEAGYALIMLVSIGVNYGAGMLLAEVVEESRRRLVLAGAVILNLGMLAVFKYANFIVDNVNPLLAALSIPSMTLAPVHLPIGISFFTFQALSYVVDVYRGQTEVQRDPLKVGLYISLFPQLIAGPIVRYQHVAASLSSRVLTSEAFAAGTGRFTLGLAKKVLIANTMAISADAVFGAKLLHVSTPAAWIGIVCYSLQIYFDFAGYSDMAIGLGQMLGFSFPENFDFPYSADSIRDFWRRWHISLSTWFRDYLYIPLGGNRCGPYRNYFNLVLVFFLCGLWHGASWNFVIWGLFHGSFLVLERLGPARMLERLWSPLRHVYVLLIVMVAWVFFRAETLPQALGYLSVMAGFAASASAKTLHLSGLLRADVLFYGTLALIGSSQLPRLLSNKFHRLGFSLGNFDWVIKTVSMATALILCLLSLASGTHNPFIYFRF